MTVLIGVALWMKSSPKPPPPPTFIAQPIREEAKPAPKVVPELIQEVNQRNAAITSVACDRLLARTWERGLPFKLRGSLYYEKHLNFRMRFVSAFGEELDIGSNNDIFWYWSRRDKHPGLYYAAYEDYQRTRLKTPFNPVFLRRILGLENINVEDARLGENEEHMVVMHKEVNSMGKNINFSIFINKADKRIGGALITDMAGTPLASAEIQECTSDGLPTKIVIVWFEEDHTLVLELTNPRANVSVSDTNWSPPNRSPRINMAEE
jgi:hypothetical protein